MVVNDGLYFTASSFSYTDGILHFPKSVCINYTPFIIRVANYIVLHFTADEVK
jgi:hypothetical protein